MDIEKIRDICLQMPHATEGIKYGDQMCFMVANKAFCSAQINKLEAMKFKVPDEDFEEMCERDGISPAPYGGARFKYVQVESFEYLTEKEWLFYLKQSYDLIFKSLTKKQLEGL